MFWDQFKSPFSLLAPMEGVTDLVFRQVVARATRPDLFVTEFTNSDSYASPAGRPNALARLRYLPSEQPIVAQIWGKTPASFAATSQGLRELGYQALDLNMGCPDRNVVRNGSGAALIKNPSLAAEIIRAAKSAGLPVSVKTRLGYSKVEEYQTWLPWLLQQDLAALTVHLRTKKELSKVAAHHELIPAIVKLRNAIAPQTKLIINGDIPDMTVGRQLAEQYGFEGVMIGRGVFQNPYCFRAEPHTPRQDELLALLNYHLDLWEEQANGLPFEPLKRFFKVYLHGQRGAHDLRARLMETRHIDEVRQILAKEGR